LICFTLFFHHAKHLYFSDNDVWAYECVDSMLELSSQLKLAGKSNNVKSLCQHVKSICEEHGDLNTSAWSLFYVKALYKLLPFYDPIKQVELLASLREKCIEISSSFYRTHPHEWFETYISVRKEYAQFLQDSGKEAEALYWREYTLDSIQNKDTLIYKQLHADALNELAKSYAATGMEDMARDMRGDALSQYQEIMESQPEKWGQKCEEIEKSISGMHPGDTVPTKSGLSAEPLSCTLDELGERIVAQLAHIFKGVECHTRCTAGTFKFYLQIKGSARKSLDLHGIVTSADLGEKGFTVILNIVDENKHVYLDKTFTVNNQADLQNVIAELYCYN
jgi:tetratricopeptide (TPR) repeat protein